MTSDEFIRRNFEEKYGSTTEPITIEQMKQALRVCRTKRVHKSIQQDPNDWVKKNKECILHFDILDDHNQVNGHISVVIRPCGSKKDWDYTNGFLFGIAFCSPQEDLDRDCTKDPEKKKSLGFHSDKGAFIARTKAKKDGPIPLRLQDMINIWGIANVLRTFMTGKKFPRWGRDVKEFHLVPRGESTYSKLYLEPGEPL